MGNEGQHIPPPDGPVQPQQYYGWQYDQDQSDSLEPPAPAISSRPLPSVQGLPPQSQFRSLRSYASGPLETVSGSLPTPPPFQPPVPQQYQQPLLDMGSSLGYGQGMEHQYFNAPQPSQTLPVLRAARLQQLRADRVRRKQPDGSREWSNTGHGPTAQSMSGLPGQFAASRSLPVEPHSTLSWEEQMQTPLPPTLLGAMPLGSEIPLPPVMPRSAGPGEAGTRDAAGAAILPPMLQRGPSGLPLSTLSQPLPVPPGVRGVPPAPAQSNGALQKLLMGRATMILSSSFIVGRLLGLLRISLFAFVFGATATSDAYLQAFLVPDLIFNIIAGSALSSAFIPVFTRYILGEKDENAAWHIASTVFNLVMAVLCVLALIALLLAPRLVALYSPGVPAAESGLIVSLTRLLLLQALILGGGVILNSILYSKQNFLLPAIGTVLYNAGLIVGLLPGFVVMLFGRTEAHATFAVYAATIGVLLGAALQVGIQVPGVVKARMHYTLSFDWKHPGTRQILLQMRPRVLNTAMLYLSTFVDRGLILLLATGPLLVNQQGLITQYYLALQLVLLPLGIFGMAVSTAAFPTMAESVTLGRLDQVRAIIEDTLRSILFLSIPSGIGLIILGVPIIQVLLQHGAFNLADATSTSVPLAFFALGLAGLAAVEILTRSFYAFRDSKTPVMVSIAQFVLKILLSLFLLRVIQWGPSWGLGSLAFATSVAGLVEAVVLLRLLRKKIGALDLGKLAMFTGRVVLASLVMGAGMLLLRTLLDAILITTISSNLGILGSCFAVLKLLFELILGILVYIWATRQLGIEDFWKQGPVRRLLERFKLSWI